MLNSVKPLTVAAVFVLLAACDIEPVSVGSWDIQIDTPDGVQTSVWTITAERTVTISGEADIVAGEVDIQGSRIFWSTESPDPVNPSGPPLRETFVGTINGDDLAGTIYTTEGNLSVSGTRQ